MILSVRISTASGESEAAAFEALNMTKLAELIVWLTPKTVCVAGNPRLSKDPSSMSSILGGLSAGKWQADKRDLHQRRAVQHADNLSNSH